MSIQAFHDHLDVCSTCANGPFNLCSVGVGLLHRAVDNLEPEEQMADEPNDETKDIEDPAHEEATATAEGMPEPQAESESQPATDSD